MRKPMDLQTLINLIVGIGVPLVGAIVIWMRSVAMELTQFRLEVSDKYVKHTQLDEIKRLLERINEKLDSKQDKQ
jgi:hypothetical protein